MKPTFKAVFGKPVFGKPVFSRPVFGVLPVDPVDPELAKDAGSAPTAP